MCPVCLTNAILIAAGTASGSGLSIVAINKFHKSNRTNRITAEPDENETKGTKDKKEPTQTSSGRVGEGMAGCAGEDAREGKGSHEGGRRLGRRTAANAVDGGREELPIRGTPR